MAEPGERIESNADTAFEPRDWPIGTIGLVLAAIFAVLVVAPLVLIGVYPASVSDVGRRLATPPPAPRLQADPEQEFAHFRAAEQHRLDGYYWVDKQQGLVHIPIAAAMQRLARQGIDGFPRGRQ